MVFSVYHDNTFPFFREFNVCSVENFKLYFKSWTLQRMPKDYIKTSVKLIKLTRVIG